jgi:peroxiredoxin
MADELKLGDRMPEALLKRLPATGRIRILYFMRGATSAVCITQLKQLQGQVARLEALRASVVAFVPEDGASVALPDGTPLIFPVVSGPDAYGQLRLRKALLGAMQQSGTAVIDESGAVLLLRRATLPFNALDERELFAALESRARAAPAPA